MAYSSAGPILDFILKRLCIKLYRALKNSKSSYFDLKHFLSSGFKNSYPISSDLYFLPMCFANHGKRSFFLQESGMRCNYGGPVYRMDDIVPQSSQHRRPLVCIQGLLIEFGLMYPIRALLWLSSSVYLERNRCVIWLF